MSDMFGMNALMKERYLGKDPRSMQGHLVRGKPIYAGMTHGANPKKMGKNRLQRAAQARLRPQ